MTALSVLFARARFNLGATLESQKWKINAWHGPRERGSRQRDEKLGHWAELARERERGELLVSNLHPHPCCSSLSSLSKRVRESEETLTEGVKGCRRVALVHRRSRGCCVQQTVVKSRKQLGWESDRCTADFRVREILKVAKSYTGKKMSESKQAILTRFHPSKCLLRHVERFLREFHTLSIILFSKTQIPIGICNLLATDGWIRGNLESTNIFTNNSLLCDKMRYRIHFSCCMEF